MKKINYWRAWWVSALTIALPAVYGAVMSAQLPARMAVHWGVNNQADGWVSKPLALYGLPILLIIVQTVVILSLAFTNEERHGGRRLGRFTLAVMPLILLVLYPVMIQVNLGQTLDMRRIVVVIVGIIFVGLGNYLPTAPESAIHLGKRHPKDPRWVRYLGYWMAASGLLMLLSFFFPAVGSLVVMGLGLVGTLVITVLSLFAAQTND